MTVYVVRHTACNEMGPSSPCMDCHKNLMELGIKRIVYSESDGSLTSCRPRDYVPYGPSLGRRYIKSGFKYSHKDKFEEEDRKKIGMSDTTCKVQ